MVDTFDNYITLNIDQSKEGAIDLYELIETLEASVRDSLEEGSLVKFEDTYITYLGEVTFDLEKEGVVNVFIWCKSDHRTFPRKAVAEVMRKFECIVDVEILYENIANNVFGMNGFVRMDNGGITLSRKRPNKHFYIIKELYGASVDEGGFEALECAAERSGCTVDELKEALAYVELELTAFPDMVEEPYFPDFIK